MSGVEWSLTSSASAKWSSEPLRSGFRCPVSTLCGISSIPVVHIVDFCQHLCFSMVIWSCLVPGVNFINFCSCTLCVLFSCKVIFHEVASFLLIFDVVEKFFVCLKLGYSSEHPGFKSCFQKFVAYVVCVHFVKLWVPHCNVLHFRFH